MIDAVFLTWNSREQALACIAHTRNPELIESIVLVDNASTDGTAKAVRAACPDVTVLALERAVGLAEALNMGARLGSAPFVLYLNDDVFAEPGAIRTLLETLQSRSDAVAAGGRLVEPDLVTQDKYRPQPFPTPRTVVARLCGLERLWPRNPWTGDHLRHALDDHTTVEVDQPAGACLLVRRSAIEQTGGWDERYWFWYEDVDFSRRLARHGVSLYEPRAPFRHAGGATARRLSAPQGHARFFHGTLQYSRTHFSWSGRAAVALTMLVVALARAAVCARSDGAGAQIYLGAARGALQLLGGNEIVRIGEPTRSGAVDTACIVCGSPAVITERFHPTLLRACTGCGLLFRAAAVDDDAVQSMYSDDTYSAERMEALTQHRTRDADQRVRWTRERVAGTRLLEVGAGTGYFVAQAARYGFEAIGIEPSDLAARYARMELGVDVRTGFLDDVDLPENDFDAACMWHVLEHAPDPLALLSGVRRRLRSGGRLVIEVPNIESVGARMMQGRWAHLDPSAHICHFSPGSLTLALEATGYEVVELETLVEGYYDRLSMRLRPRRLAGRAVRALRLHTLALTHPSNGELLRVIAAPVP